MTDGHELEPDAAAMRAMHETVGAAIVAWIRSLPSRPADATAHVPDLIERAGEPPPEQGRSLHELLDVALSAADPSYESAGPGYLAYVPGGGLHAAAVGEWLASALNRYTGVSAAAPAAVALEQSVLRWMCDLFELPGRAQGLLLSGGSMANLVALATARSTSSPESSDRAVVYTGEQAHASVRKAARTVGIRPDRIRSVGSDDALRVRVDEIAAAIETDRAAGLTPVAIVAAAGTTNTGTVDPLADLAALADERDVWLHVDAAYGGFFQLTARGRATLRGLDRADSITLDPHKTLFLPYGTGALLVRDGGHLAATFAEDADYLQDLDGTEQPDFNAISPELSREWRGLRVWLPLHLHGLAAFRAALDEKLDLAADAYEDLRAEERLEVIPPELSIVAFRYAGGDDHAQLELLRAINRHGRVLLSSTRIRGEVWLRLAIVSHRTHEDRVREALTLVRDELDTIAS